MAVYTITVSGRAYRYRTPKDALRVAEEIFRASGVVVGIEEESDRRILGEVTWNESRSMKGKLNITDVEVR